MIESMAKHPTLFLSLLLAAGCGTAPEPKKAEAPPPSAGTVERLDAAFDALVPANATIEKLAGGMKFIEGPLWMPAGHLLFSDVVGNVIYKWAPGDTAASVFLEKSGADECAEGSFCGSNGLTLDKQGRVLIAMHGRGRIAALGPDGKQTPVAEKYQGKRLNSPNDMAWKSDGSLYFTDPPYGFPKQDDDPKKELKFNGIYRLDPDGRIRLLHKDMTRPNGIGFSPDEKTLYVANSDPAKKLWMKFAVAADGSLGAPSVLMDVTPETADGLPDGLKLDKQGNLFATGPGGVWVFSPEGKLLGKIKPSEVPANVGWGDDGKSLYMTARTGLYRIRLTTEGVKPGV
jgi:gluconolactonase